MNYLQKIFKLVGYFFPIQKTELAPHMEGDTLITIRRVETDQVVTIVRGDVQLSEDEKISLASLCRALSYKLKNQP